jgi:threonine dehydrogenase-like Zn-dependent dehydrogenase
VLGIKAHHGAFAEYLTLPIATLHVVPDDMPDEVAVFAEPAAAALHVLEQVQVGVGARVVVVGCGRLGLLCAQALRPTGCELVVVGRSATGRARARALGLETCDETVPPRRQADVVLECSGERSGFELARALVRPRGTLVLKSTYHGRTEVDLSSLVVDELTLVGSRCGDLAPALRALAAGTFAVRASIEARYALREGLQAFEHASGPGVLKVLIEPSR